MELSDAIWAAVDARKEDLRGKYPLAAQVLAEEVTRLRAAIQMTLDDNGHLADGDNCTLIHLVRAIEPPNVI